MVGRADRCSEVASPQKEKMKWRTVHGTRFTVNGHNMSRHRSLKSASGIATKRNVLKRFERVEILKKRGKFKPGDSVFKLPKTKPDA